MANQSTQVNRHCLREALDETVLVLDGSAFGLCLLLGPGEVRELQSTENVQWYWKSSLFKLLCRGILLQSNLDERQPLVLDTR